MSQRCPGSPWGGLIPDAVVEEDDGGAGAIAGEEGTAGGSAGAEGVAGGELRGAPTAISQRCPGSPWGGFMPGAVDVAWVDVGAGAGGIVMASELSMEGVDTGSAGEVEPTSLTGAASEGVFVVLESLPGSELLHAKRNADEASKISDESFFIISIIESVKIR